jgi:hypothetical protein
MSTREKLIERFKSRPKDFTFSELEKLLAGFGFGLSNKGTTSGSRVKFINKAINASIDIHKPHKKGDSIKETALKGIYDYLVNINLIK